MKKLLVAVLIVCSCGGSEVVEEPITTTTTTSIEIVNNTTTTTVFIEEDFLEYYKENNIKGYIDFTPEELEKTKALYFKYPSYFEWGESECYIKDRGTTQEALLDEYLPVFANNEWYFSENFIVTDSNNNDYVYWLDIAYNCKLINDNSEYPDWEPLYGRPFYQNNKWWAFKWTDRGINNTDFNIPGMYASWATRVEIEGFEQTYDEWVTNAINPEIVFGNCPEEPITDTSFELSWDIIAGNSDIDYVFIVFEKNGEYETRAYFEKEFNEDIFPFPLANTRGEFGQLVSNSDEGITNYVVSFEVTDELNNRTRSSCEVTFDN